MERNNDGKRRRFRPEARPFALETLQKQQLHALRALTEWLDEAVASAAANTASQPRLPDYDWLDPQRQNQVFFLSGCRGSGKTSVLLSLMGALASEADTAGSTEEIRDIELRIRALRDDIIWLETLDLEPLPKPTNLLAAILARVERAVERRRKEGHSYALSEEERQAHADLRRLQNDIAMAWDGNLAERAAQLDPEVFAIEALQAERSRLALNQRLSHVIEQVSSVLLPERRLANVNGKRKPVFVLFVDDFDLNPLQAVQLLRLLRMISVRQLFTILSGDIQMAERMNYLMVSGQFARMGGEYQPLEPEILHYASDISANALRKLVPPSQRHDLEMLTIEDTLGFRPTEKGDPTIRELLGRIHFSATALGPEPMTVGAFLTGRGLLGVTQAASKPAYRGASILHAPVRHVLDLWFTLRALSQLDDPAPNDPDKATASQKRVLDFAAQTLRSCINEEPHLDFAARTRFLDAVAKEPIRNEWELEGGVFDLRTLLGSEFTLRPRLDSYEAAQVLPELTFRVVRGWTLRPRAKPSEQQPVAESRPGNAREELRYNDARPLGDRIVGALALFHDLLKITGQGVVAPELRDENIEERAFCIWPIPGRALRVPWFNSVWDTMWDFEAFAQTWNYGLESARDIRELKGLDEPELITTMAFFWIAGGVAVLTNGEHRPRQLATAQPNSYWTNDDRLDWPALRRGIAAVVREWFRAQRQSRFDLLHKQRHTWLINLACLLAPEAGVTGDIWEREWLDIRSEGPSGPDAKKEDPLPEVFENQLAWFVREVWRDDGVARAVRNRRAQRLERGLLTPLGLSLVAPDVAQAVLTNAQGASTHSSQVQEVANMFAQHPINQVMWRERTWGHCLCPGERTILRTLSGAPRPVEESERQIREAIAARFYKGETTRERKAEAQE